MKKLLLIMVFWQLPATGWGASVSWLEAIQAVTPEGAFYIAPQFTPDGSSLLATSAKFSGLYRFPLADTPKPPLRITDAPGAGFGYALAGDGTIFFKQTLLQEKKLETQVHAFPFDGLRAFQAEKVRRVGSAELLVAPDMKRFAYVASSGALMASLDGEERELLPGPGLYHAVLSPDEKTVLVHTSKGHVLLYRLDTGSTTDIGVAYAADFHPKEPWIVFEFSRDDGHEITSSDLYLYHILTGKRFPLLTGDARRPMHPAFSPDGSKVAFEGEATGQIFVGTVNYKAVTSDK